MFSVFVFDYADYIALLSCALLLPRAIVLRAIVLRAFVTARICLRAFVGAVLSCALLSGHHIRLYLTYLKSRHSSVLFDFHSQRLTKIWVEIPFKLWPALYIVSIMSPLFVRTHTSNLTRFGFLLLCDWFLFSNNNIRLFRIFDKSQIWTQDKYMKYNANIRKLSKSQKL